MAQAIISTKRIAISKANAQMVIAVAVASFLSVFCLVASQAVLSQNNYQARVIAKKETAHKQLKQNIDAYSNLASAYRSFNKTSTNVIGGNTTGTADNDGTNTKIILDALPRNYDFPALTSSIEKILTDNHFNIGSITGTDDQLNQQTNVVSPNPQPVPVPFVFSVNNASYALVQQLITKLQQSIRPIQVDSINLSGGATDMSLTVNAHTYFQPSKNLSITKEAVK